jgi:hypothetical protein
MRIKHERDRYSAPTGRQHSAQGGRFLVLELVLVLELEN